MTAAFNVPTDKRRREAASRGHERSILAQGRFGNKPVSLKPPPWEKPNMYRIVRNGQVVETATSLEQAELSAAMVVASSDSTATVEIQQYENVNETWDTVRP